MRVAGVPEARPGGERGWGEHLDKLYLLTRTGICKDALAQFRDRQEATSRFLLAAILLNSDVVLKTIRRELRRVTELLVDQEEIRRVLHEQVIKRDTLEGEQAQTAARRLTRRSDRLIRRTGSGATQPGSPTTEVAEGDPGVEPPLATSGA